jgi:hypothetical protein
VRFKAPTATRASDSGQKHGIGTTRLTRIAFVYIPDPGMASPNSYGVPRTLAPAKAANDGRRRPSRHELADNLAADVSKPEVAALEAVGQLGVVESEQV